MSDNTHIEWTDATWNPITGCSVVSAGCKHCYAMRLAGTRLAKHPSRKGLTLDTAAGPVWNGHVRFNEEWLDQPLWWKRPRHIFVCAHGDLFHESVPDEWIDAVFAVMALARQHVFQVLTKRPARMLAYLKHPETAVRVGLDALHTCLATLASNPNATIGSGVSMKSTDINPGSLEQWPLPNVWLMVSAEHQEAADARIPLLREAPAAVRGVSLEPLLGPISLQRACRLEPGGSSVDLDWVIVGGESGPGARPMRPSWVRSLRDECAALRIPFFFKQWGNWAPQTIVDASPGGSASPHAIRTADFEVGEELLQWVPKKRAGRTLDGMVHDGMPMTGLTQVGTS